MASTPVERMFSHPRKAIMSVSMLAFLCEMEVHFKDNWMEFYATLQHNQPMLKMIKNS